MQKMTPRLWLAVWSELRKKSANWREWLQVTFVLVVWPLYHRLRRGFASPGQVVDSGVDFQHDMLEMRRQQFRDESRRDQDV